MNKLKVLFIIESAVALIVGVSLIIGLIYNIFNWILLLALFAVFALAFFFVKRRKKWPTYKQVEDNVIIRIIHPMLFLVFLETSKWHDDLEWIPVVYFASWFVEGIIRTYELNFKELAETAADSNEDNCISSE